MLWLIVQITRNFGSESVLAFIIGGEKRQDDSKNMRD
jgi:hypothetical protein